MINEAKRPNILFIMADQQRADSFGPNRHPCANFPVLEGMAEESVVFRRFYAAAMACVASRHAFLTGHYPWQDRVAGNARFLTGDQTTWMSVLRNHGYRSVSVGKTHMVHAGSTHIQVPIMKSYNDKGIWGEGGDWNHFEVQVSEEPEDTYFEFFAVRRACEAIDRLTASSDNPFAMFLGFHAPHEPYVLPERYAHWLDPEYVPLPKARAHGELNTKSTHLLARRKHLESVLGRKITDNDVRVGIAGHHGAVKMVDDCVGLMLDHLRKRDLLDNTLVIFCSDHGEMLGEHHIFNKAATFYEGEIRLPMIMRFPERWKAGTQCTHLASSMDWVPTLFDYLDIDADMGLPGQSLMPMIEHNEPVHDHLMCSTGRGLMIRDNRWKLWIYAEDDEGEMYDLETDPLELNNLYADPAHAPVRTALTDRMLRQRIKADIAEARTSGAERLLMEEACATLEPQVITRHTNNKL
jgi:choline-sulfatase